MTRWIGKRNFKRVVLAIEDDIVDGVPINEHVQNQLQQMPPFTDVEKWVFDLVSHADQLLYLDEPDVLVISRDLPGQKPEEVLKYISEAFPNAHKVILAGDKNEQAKSYSREARRLGLNDIVTGPLPGDSPYFIDLAIQFSYDEITGKSTAIQAPSKMHEGFIIAVAGAKGGIGKTTVCSGLALALSEATSTVTMDSDYTRVDLTAFFQIDSQCSGIEVIDPTCVTANEIEGLLVPVKNIDKLRCLPGPRVNTDWDWMQWPSTDVARVLEKVRETAPLVIVDTPSNNECSYIPEILRKANLVVVVIDQSRFSDQDIFSYGESLAGIGVEPANVRVVVNKWINKGKTPQTLLKEFYRGLGGSAPRVVNIPADLEAFILASHKMEIPGLEDPKGPWQVLAGDIAKAAGIPWQTTVQKKKGFLPFWKRFAS